MLDIGFSELLLIAVVGLIVIGPKDLPVVMRHVMKAWRELRGVYLGIKKQAVQLMDEAGINEVQEGISTIIDLEGKPQKAYDVRELEGLRATQGIVPIVETANDHESQGVSLSPRERLGEGLVRAKDSEEAQLLEHALLQTAAQATPSPQPSPSGRGSTPPASHEVAQS